MRPTGEYLSIAIQEPFSNVHDMTEFPTIIHVVGSPKKVRNSRSQEIIIDEYDKFKGPSLLKQTLGLQRRHHGLYVGGSGKIERILTPSPRISEIAKTPHDGSYRHVNGLDTFLIRPDQGTELYEEEIGDLDAIEDLVAPHGRALIDLYFRIVHPSFPILHKKVYLEKYERTHREFSPVLLAAVYILATDYWSYSLEMSGAPAPDIKCLEELAWKSMSYAINRPKLSTVEAGLLLLQRPTERLWPLTAQMVAVGQDLGLHRDCSNWDIPVWERGLRKRLAWALFMQDKWASLVQGRPPHISSTDWAVQPLMEQDFPENFVDENDEEGSTEVEKGRILYTCMVSLTQILSDILTSLYSGAAEEDRNRDPSTATTRTLMKVKPLQIRLRDWYTSLPHCLDIEHIKFRKLSSNGYLHLAYWVAEITLHRCITRTLGTCPDPGLVRICQNAATARSESAMDFVRSLKSEHWQSFWYFASEFSFGLIGVFESLLSTTFSSEHDISASVSRVDQYRWVLKMAKKNAEFLDGSLAMMDLAAKHSRQVLASINDQSSSRYPCSQQDHISEQHVEPFGSPEQFQMDHFDFDSSPGRELSIPTSQKTDFNGFPDYAFFDVSHAIGR